MKWYDVHELLTFALPRVPIERAQPLRFDWRAIRHDPVEIEREGARLFADSHNRVDLRDICRTVAPWFTRAVPRDEYTADIVPCDGDEWFRAACGRVSEWLSRPCEYLHREDVAAYLGPYTAIECARQCSPTVRHLLALPEVAPVIAVFERGEDVDEEAWRAAGAAIESRFSEIGQQLHSESRLAWNIAHNAVLSLIHRQPDFTYIAPYLQGAEVRAEWAALYAAEKRETPPA
jgi:hypothetical protein